jgi:hypothetical protein
VLAGHPAQASATRLAVERCGAERAELLGHRPRRRRGRGAQPALGTERQGRAAPGRHVGVARPVSRPLQRLVATACRRSLAEARGREVSAAERLTAQGLAGPPAADPLAVAERLLAVQAQDLRGARLALRARSRGLAAVDVDRALGEQRSLVVTWLNRGTLHLVRSEDLAWLHALTTPPGRAPNARRLAQEGVDASAAERGVAVVERALVAEGPLGREALRARLDAAGVRTQGQALVHVLVLAALRGLVVRGPIVDGEQAYVLARDWLGELSPGTAVLVDRARALAELARRFLAAHGPAAERDLARWAGLPLRDVRAGLRGIAPALADRPDGLLALAAAPVAAELPPPRLLGAFDPLLHGWVDRRWVLGDRTDVVTLNGVFRPIALVGGRAVATWGLPRGKVELAPFAPLDAATERALDADAGDVLRFLGRPRAVGPRYGDP